MKKYILILVFTLFVVLMFNFCSNSSSKEKKSETKEVAAVQYTCPMHSEVVSDTAGTCPKCGMTLVEKKK